MAANGTVARELLKSSLPVETRYVDPLLTLLVPKRFAHNHLFDDDIDDASNDTALLFLKEHHVNIAFDHVNFTVLCGDIVFLLSVITDQALPLALGLQQAFSSADDDG